MHVLFQNIGQVGLILISFYQSYKKYLPTLSFFAGFIWDSLTIKRIDTWSNNLFLMLYLCIIMVSIFLTHLVDKQQTRYRFLIRLRKWYPEIIQFCFGSLLSVYTIYYFKSASFTKTGLFFLLIAIVFVANEFLKERLSNLYLQFSMFFLCSFSFCIFFLPVVFKKMTVGLFLLGGIISLLVTLLFLTLLYYLSLLENPSQYRRLVAMVGCYFLLFNGFYFMNWIPPVPLSLKHAGIYHSVQRQGEVYHVRYATPKWYHFYRRSENPFRYTPGDTVFCYAAVFAPTQLKKTIYHQWYEHVTGQGWQMRDRMTYELIGGRDDGYRGYTFKCNVTLGKWRVDICTEEGLLVGRVNFHIIAADSTCCRWKTKML